jgi:glycerol-3-phosphate dehydrogenase
LWSKAKFEDSDAVLSKGARLFFVTPWHEYSIIGTEHVHYDGDPSDFRIKETDIQSFLDDVNEAYPPADLKREDVTFFYGGLLPADPQHSQGTDVKLLKTYKLIDHQESGIDGLITVVGVKYTTARDVAAKTVDYIARRLGKTETKSKTSVTPVFGGDLSDVSGYVEEQKQADDTGLAEAALERLIANHGTAYTNVLEHVSADPNLSQPITNGSLTLVAEVLYAVREEMAVKLADVIRRRTELGSAGNPGAGILQKVASIMAAELSWDETRIAAEIAETNSIYEPAE